MKKFGRGLVLAAGLACLGLMSATVLAAPSKFPASHETRITGVFEHDLATLQRSLRPAQLDMLIDASTQWPRDGVVNEAFMDQVDQDLSRILTPFQQELFYSLLTPPSTTGGGTYLPSICFASSKFSMIFSILGVLGCPSETAKSATLSAYEAAAWASICLLEGASTCDDAVQAAASSYISWSQLMGTCDLADSATAAVGATYVFCGGVF